MNECPKCGAILPSGEEVLCQNCGTAFGGKTTVMAAVSAPRPGQKPAAPNAGAATGETQQAPAKGAGSKMPFVVLAILGAVAVVCIIVLVLLLTGD